MKTTPALLLVGLTAYREQDLHRATSALQSALAQDPSCAEAASHLALLSLYDPSATPATRLNLHLEWARAFQPPHAAAPPVRHTHLRPRIGYVRDSLSREPGGSFLPPILRNHDPARFDVSAWSADPADAALPVQWHNIAGMSPEAIATAIRASEIDILVNVPGHFDCALMQVFAARPAPLQVSLSYYPFSTGLDAVCLRVTDPLADPLPESAPLYTERLLHLPCFLPFDAPRYSPPLAPAPCRTNGWVTFGCFNNPLKVSPRALEQWAALIAEIPGSRFLFHHPFLTRAVAIQDRLSQPFLRRGIAPERLAFIGSLAHWDHLDLHREVDLLLDTSPYSGVTTTLEALWMGVPVVTAHAGSFLTRTSAVILAHAGLGHLAAPSPDLIPVLARSLAADPAQLDALRPAIAAAFRASPFFRHQDWVRELEAALLPYCSS